MKKLVLVLLLSLPLLGQALKPENRPLQGPSLSAQKREFPSEQRMRMLEQRGITPDQASKLLAERKAIMASRYNFEGRRNFMTFKNRRFKAHNCPFHFNHRPHRHHRMMCMGRG